MGLLEWALLDGFVFLGDDGLYLYIIFLGLLLWGWDCYNSDDNGEDGKEEGFGEK